MSAAGRLMSPRSVLLQVLAGVRLGIDARTGTRWTGDLRENQGQACSLDPNRSAPGTADPPALQAPRHLLELPQQLRQTLDATNLVLPAGQSSHVLRHTSASRFVMNGGNILTLQKILGHQSLAMTMRYAHLAPDHLQDAVRLGPQAWKNAFSSEADPR